jgi:hypothetical protein
MQTSQLFYNFIAMVLMCSNAFFQVENSTRATQQEITINFDLLDLRGTLHPLSQNDKGGSEHLFFYRQSNERFSIWT